MRDCGVLVVDDEVSIVEGLRLLLDAESIPNDGAGDRLTALDRIAESFYPLILADLCLRTTAEGLQLVEEIRRLSPRTRVVTISGYATPELETQLRERGVAHVFHKPLGSAELMAVVHQILREIECESAAEPEAELAELYERVKKVLYSIPRKYGLARETAEDVVQQAWLLYLVKRGEVRNPRVWLSGTTVNLCRQELERARHLTGDPDEVLPSVPEERSTDPSDVLAMRQALERIDSRSRDLCEWIGIEGYSYWEVSNAVALPEGSVGPLYIRAKKKLVKALLN